MLLTDIVVIFWLSVIVILSGIFCSVVFAYISNKAPVEQTIIDLTYKDCLIYIFFMTLSSNTAFINCLMAADNVLDFCVALFYADVILFFISCVCISVAISSALRLLTIVSSSQENGIQLLGPDDRAILKIRFVAMGLSAVSILIANIVFQSFPPIVGLFVQNQKVTVLSMVRRDLGMIIYLAPPTAAAVFVVAANIVSN